MRIGIVNHVRATRETLRRVVESSPAHRVAWTAADGAEAIVLARDDPPDLILMGLVMPGVDGVEATRRIMEESPCPILVVTASVKTNVRKVYEALGHGAIDAVDTPRLGSRGEVKGAARLLRKIAALERLAGDPPSESPEGESWGPGGGPEPVAIVALVASTGGPKVLARILGDLPADLPAAVVIVQHVDAAFAAGLVQWLGHRSRLPVRAIAPGTRPRPGQAFVAQTNDHLVLRPDGMLDYTPEPRELSFRPSADVFFRSLSRSASSPGVAVVLTGMGDDGAQGLSSLRRHGWHTIAQDQASSPVWGMPRAAVAADAVVEVRDQAEIGPAIVAALDSRSLRKRGGP